MSRGTTLWLVTLAVLLILELVIVFSVGRGPYDSRALLNTYQAPGGSSLSVNPSTGVLAVESSTEASEALPPAFSVITDALPVVLGAAFLLFIFISLQRGFS